MNASPLLTDLYEITMACGYWKTGKAEQEAVFHLFFRQAPFGSGYTIACGLEPALDWLRDFRFQPDDLAYLATLTGNDGKPVLAPGFLEYLAGLRLTVDVDAVPEGTVVFAQEPLLRVSGPIIQGQLLEPVLLCLLNFDTLVATKAARICGAARGEPVLEFGLRRAQGVDGAMAASRAAYIGGCAATSNVLAGKRFGIPVKGTHAHSWVLAFGDELEAFLAYAAALPNNCVFLVDTFDTLDGVRHAVQAAKRLREQGHEMVGIRLDSGDLAWLSIEARKILDDAGFPKAVIVGSNDLDEHLIESLKHQGAAINVWGVGTRLVTSYDQPALGGVYKLTAIRDPNGTWLPRLKLSEQAIKTTTPGIQQVRRFIRNGEAVGDVIWDEMHPAPAAWTMVDPLDPTRRKVLPPDASSQDLLQPVLRQGEPVGRRPILAESRDRAQAQLKLLHAGIQRLDNPHTYPVGLELGLHERKAQLIMEARTRREPHDAGQPDAPT
ncbi:MAG: nicotinate phosphoribosyltransferase [Lentisphaerae bacterium RIFOXYB12_FULL_65_16]|nr:MAG: nicotinate phosphoribosyltransferase [Lentisphaerae bacterium RIFOXYA12_64_32]OGV89907.1 MAG: nicotinate phosphoribosyltransferase [Lentisphaerae bacterium RIFOXYB12_FULL_65_16]